MNAAHAGTFPALAAPGSVVRAYDRLAEWLLFLPIVIVTFLSKIAFPVGSTQVSVGIPLLLGTALFGMFMGRMRLHLANLALYLAMVTTLLLLQVMSGNPFSINSLLLLIVVHAAYGVAMRPGLVRPDIQLKFFQDVTTIIAIAGMIQFVTQYVVPYDYAFPIETKLPSAIVIEHFNYLNPLFYGSERYKSNGVFMLEPASFCQLCAIAIVIEWLYYRRLWRLIAFAGGMVVSYSGTGVIVLGVVLPILIISHRRFDLLILMMAGALIAYVGFDALQLDIFARRMNEFSSPESSGFARYIGGFYLFEQYQWPNIGNALLGLGAGSAYPYGQKATFASSELSWVKMIFEFGLIGAAVYFIFLFKCIFGMRRFALLGLALAATFLQNGALVPAVHGLILGLVVWPSLEPAKAQAPQWPAAAGPVPATPLGR